MKPFLALVRRETWESQAFWVVPGVFALVLIGGALFTLLGLSQYAVSVDEIHLGLAEIGRISSGEHRELLKLVLVTLAAPFNVFLVGVMFFYALDALYADRRDRSVLFFKSLPVSDLATVLSKLTMALLAGPALALVVVMVYHLIMVVTGAGVMLWLDVDGWYRLLDPLALISAWGLLAWALFAQSLVYLPLVAWLMLASAWARKAPFLWAVVPPVVVIVIEEWFFDDSRLAEWLGNRMTEVLPLSFRFSGQGLGRHNGEWVSDGRLDVAFDILWSGMLWQGVAVAAVLLGGAVLLRRYRADAE